MIWTTIINVYKVDFVLIDVYSTQNFWFAIFTSQICRLFNCKYITKLHGGNLPQRLENNPVLSDLIFKNAYKLTAPSEYLYDFFKRKYSENLVFIPNTIELENYTFEAHNFDYPKLLWVRSLSDIYNPKMAIKVLSEIKKTHPKAILAMVGPDKNNLLEELKEYATSLNVEVNFTGLLSKETWTEFSKEYNIFINTTHFDNTPVSVIEAMALGLPVISTNVGGIPNLIQHKKNGLLVNDDDDQEMTKCIIELIDNYQFKDTIVKNARKMVENFDWQTVKQQWLEILN
jgi:glycosyltransferase involved in cell wall biosynthesis